MKEPIAVATGHAINLITIPHNANPTPQAIILSCSAMTMPENK